jgi:predicted porin
MTKNILAIAIAAAVMAPSAFAAATVYGQAHMSVDSLDSGSESVMAVGSNSSRLGIKGSEDLGGGLKAVYQYEMQLAMDGDTTGSGGIDGQRNTFAGIGGDFGTVLLGIHDTPVKLVGRKYDLFGDRVGDMRNLTGTKDGAGYNFDLRPKNVLAYASPTFGGVSVLAAYVFQEGTTSNGAYVTTNNGSNAAADKTDAYSVMVSYAAGKMGADLGYENHSNAFSGINKSTAATRLGASYDFGMVKAHAFYANQDAVSGTEVKARNIYGVGAAIAAGAAGKVNLQVGMADAKNGGNDGATMYAVGYDHNMTKNTTVYAIYAMTNNDTNGQFNVAGGGHGENFATIAKGKDPSAVSVGLRHNF